jgi:signal transduction histidine kinase
MAGAACHELAQPVTTLAFMVDKLLRTASKDDPLYRNLLQLAREVDRVGALVHRISQVSEYVTKPYVKGMKIIDVDAAAGKNGPGKQKEVDK